MRAHALIVANCVPRATFAEGSGAQASLTPPATDGSLVQMLQWFRAGARSIAATALISLVTLNASLAAPHQDDCHEAMCASGVVPHDPSAHSVGRATASTG